MPDQELCENCLEPLCDECGNEAFRARHKIIGRHHLAGSLANDLCPRPKVVMVKGCAECALSWFHPNDGEILHCGHPGAPDLGLTNNINQYSKSGRPGWCPFLDQKTGQPAAGTLLKAEIPATEEG